MKKIIYILIFFVIAGNLFSQRIKDFAFIKGVSTEQLIGYGIVVGLAGTGDSYRSSFTVQSVTSMLKRFGITVPDINLRTKNVAAVMVTSRVNNFVKTGSEFDVTVSSMGDATSLLGGTLLMTPLSSKTGKVFGVCQGQISIGGYDINTSTGGRVSKNHALSGRIPNGGVLQEDFPFSAMDSSIVYVVLKSPDFTTANNVAAAVNQKFTGSAFAKDASEIKVTVPANYQDKLTTFLAELESITVQTDVIARVVLNEKTGTIVAGSNVKILPVTISHGSLKITINQNPIVSQPNPFSRNGNTAVLNQLVPTAESENGNAVSIQGASNVQEVAAALNSLKVSPRDIIAIFQALKEAGALQAELIII